MFDLCTIYSKNTANSLVVEHTTYNLVLFSVVCKADCSILMIVVVWQNYDKIVVKFTTICTPGNINMLDAGTLNG